MLKIGNFVVVRFRRYFENSVVGPSLLRSKFYILSLKYGTREDEKRGMKVVKLLSKIQWE